MFRLTCLLVVFVIGSVVASPFEKNDAGTGKQWAFIVAGSNMSANLAYSIQGSAYHAYHVLRDRGIPAEQIVLFSWDDAAFSEGYKYPGKIFVSPDKKDVRKGVAIDYKGSDVNPANILAALSGNKSAIVGGNGRVIESNENDTVFVFFMDHGNVGVFFVGDNDSITKKEFHETLKGMHADRKFSQLAFYMDACHSGSIFDTLPKDLNTYVVTSASPHENANAMYCPDDKDDSLPDEIGTCLAPLFTSAWLADTQQSKPDETLKKQYESLKKIVAKSPDDHTHQKVSHYGNLSIATEPLTTFQGRSKNEGTAAIKEFETGNVWPYDEVPLRLIMHRVKQQARREKLSEEATKQRLEQARKDFAAESRRVSEFFIDFTLLVVGDEEKAQTLFDTAEKLKKPLTQLDCHHDGVRAFQKKCIPLLPMNYEVRLYAKIIAELCEGGIGIQRILEGIDKYC